MIIIRNKHLPFKGFQAINLFGAILVREEHFPLSPISINHEKIHARQMAELFFLFFYLIYFLEWVFRSVQHRNLRQGYYAISFEREAYQHQADLQYLKRRIRWSFSKYFSTKKAI